MLPLLTSDFIICPFSLNLLIYKQVYVCSKCVTVVKALGILSFTDFPQNRAQEPGCSFHFTGEMTEVNYNFLPPKKKIKVILQERRRILDHDYEIGSDEDPPQQFVPETDEESNDTYETSGFLSSDTPGYLHEEGKF